MRRPFYVNALDAPLIEAFTRLKGSVSELDNLFEEVAERVREEFRETFETENHGKWAPLARSTQRAKERRYPGARALRRTDRLFDSLTKSGAPGSVFDLSERGLLVGTSVPYASKHQLGTSEMPARPFVFLSDEARQDIAGIAFRYLEESL